VPDKNCTKTNHTFTHFQWHCETRTK